MVLKCALNELVGDVECQQLVNVGMWKILCKWLTRR